MITIRDILSNISGGQSAIQVKYILKALNDYYESIKDDIEITYAKAEANGTTMYFKILGSRNKIKYDVVIWVDTDQKIGYETKLKIYSNSPGFAYNYAYSFYKENSLLFANLYPSEFRKLPAVTRNPLDVKSFDKHVYACLKAIIARRSKLSSLSEKYEKTIEPKIKTFKDKTNEIEYLRQLEKKKAASTKKK